MEKKNEPGTKFILSTIHSSKGLEYDSVILIDVLNGVFPNKVLRTNTRSTAQEKKDFEEERRIFYVGMTRAREHLTIFKYKDRPSVFIRELSNKQPIPEEMVSAKPAHTYSATQATSYLQRMMKQKS